MPKLNSYVDIDTVEREARKDYIDRHSPFIHCESSAKAGEKFAVTVRMGEAYEHPDDTDHYIAEIKLFDGETQLGAATYFAGANGGQGTKSQAEVTFYVVPSKKMKLQAISYCTKHGLWQSDPVEVSVA